MQNEQIVLNERPEGLPKDDTFKYEAIQTENLVRVKYN